MKRCPRCNRIYSDNDLNFCLDDGELLQHYNEEEPTRPLGTAPPPTLILESPRATDPIGWAASQPIGQWQGQAGAHPQTQYQPYPVSASPNQTLAIISLCVGAASLVIGWCCSIGLVLAPASIVVGIVSLFQIKKDPKAYGGRGLAYGGIAAASLYLVLLVLFWIIWGVFTFMGPISGR